MDRTEDARAAIEQVFRAEHGRVIASLIRAFHNFDLAEEAIQEAFAVALEHWPHHGVPPNPAAWIAVTARRKALDIVRRERVRIEKYATLGEPGTVVDEESDMDDERGGWLGDDRLRLVFTCCHPALSLEAQVALTLRTLGGLSTGEI